jgi:hypothetical protein
MSSGVVFILVLMVGFLVYFIYKMVTGRSSQTNAKDWLLYFLIAPLMIAAFLGFFFYADRKGIHEEVSLKWMNIFITATFVFGYTVKEFWQYRRRWTFWAELGVLVVAHFVVLQRLHWEKASYFWLILAVGIPEMVAVLFLMGLMFEPKAGHTSEDS